MNILDLEEFYKSPLGYILATEIRNLLKFIWGNENKAHSYLHVGYGYPIHFLNQQDSKNLVFFPSHMGAITWPEHSNRCVLMDETLWPLFDQSADRILLVHGLEYALHPHLLLAECHRVLKKDGTLVVIAPNRRSPWAHSDKTPLGYGQPYTMTQLIKKLESAHFCIQNKYRTLYTPPLNKDICISFSELFEKTGKVLLPKLNGMVAVTAQKEIPLVAQHLKQTCSKKDTVVSFIS